MPITSPLRICYLQHKLPEKTAKPTSVKWDPAEPDSVGIAFDDGTYLVVAKDLIEDFKEKLSLASNFNVLRTIQGMDLIGTSYFHPLYDRTSQVLEGGDYITTETGTGLVHTAPGHGQEDYQTGLKYD